MAIGFNIQFRINEKTESRVIRLTDTSTGFTITKGIFSIVYPDGTSYSHTDFNNPDITAAGQSYDYQASADIYNNVLTGQYVITFVGQDAGLNTQTIQRTIDFNWIKPTKSIINLSDTMIPEVKFQDSTVYTSSGSFTGVLTSRTFNVLMPTTSAVTGTTVTAVSNIIDAVVSTNYYEGVYTPKSDVVVTYTHNTLSTSLTVLYTALLQKDFSIKKAPTRQDLITRINLFRTQVDAYKESNDTQFEILSEEYDILIALYSHLIERAQTSTLDGSQDILIEIINILDKYTPYTYQSGPISAFFIQPFGLGTVTSIGLTMPTGFTVSNSPVTSSGNIGVVFTAGYSIPTTIKQSNWDDAYTWVAAFPTQTGNAGKFLTTNGSTLSWVTNPLGTVTSVGLSAPTGFSVASSPVTSSGTIALSFAAGYSLPSDATQATWTAKQNALSGTGFVKISGTTISYDNSTYYLASNPSGYITGITSGMVTTALGYTPYNATNPSGYISGNQTITLSGAVTGSGATAITTTLANSVVGISNLSAIGTPSSTTYLRGDNTWATVVASGGTVTSVGLSMPPAFTVTSSPITSSGTIAVAGAGTASQYITGDGSLATFPTSIASASQMTTFGRNSTGATLYRGTVVYISGSTGNVPNFSKALGVSDATSARTFGIVKDDIANNADGYVVSIGSIDNLDTRTAANGAANPFTSDVLADGDTVYLSPTTAGYVTNVKPYAPNHLVYIGKVIRTSPTNGTIVYQIQNGYELDELHDVQVGPYVNKDILYRDTATNLWKNASITTVLGYTPYNATNPNSYIALTALSSTATGLTYTNTTGVFSLTSGYVIPTTTSATNWDTAYTNRITSLTTTGSSGSATLTTNTLNIPTYTLSGLGGQASSTNLTSLSGLTYASTSFVKMTAAGTFSLDTNTYYLASNPSGYTANAGTVTSVAALTIGTTGTDLTSTVANGNTTPVITLNVPTASATNRGALSSGDWTTFNSKQGAITLTTTGTTGAATLVGNTLNIPQYVGGVSSFNTRTGAITLTSGDVTGALTYTPVPTTRTITINGTTYDLSADRSWTISGGGGTNVGSFSRTIQTFTATASQTTFTISGGYTAGYIDVYVNGVRLTGADYTASNGTTVVMGAGLLVGDIVDVTIYGGIALSGTAPISFNTTTGEISISQATTSTNGYLSSTDWNTFNGKQGTITLTTTGTSGAATLVGNTLNIPNYSTGGGSGTVTTVSVVSANGFAGSVATATSTPSITISTTVSGILKGNGTAISAATANTDYLAVNNPVYTGILGTGTLTYSPANLFLYAQDAQNSYIQAVFQNSNSQPQASADIVLNNNLSTDTSYYGDFGINSSNFNGTGSLSLPNAVYLTATTGDLVLGTTTSNSIRFVINDGATDAATIKTTSQLQLPAYTTTTSFTGTVAGYLAFDSSGNVITTAAPSFGYTVTTQSTTYSVTATSGTLIVKGNTTSAGFTITLPTAVGNTATIVIKKVAAANILTIGTTSSQTIDGATTAQIKVSDASITLISDNANWQII